jgi:catechol 2,3-dioxygenase-like lactoylglutathione lyase family enzyme
MITSAHTVLYAEDAAAARLFFRDVLGFEHVDAGEGWLIFRLPPSELGVHPTGPGPASGRHELFFVCHDIEQTVGELTAKGVEFTGGVTDAGFGLLTSMKVPGAGEIGLYEPRHPLAAEPQA